MEMLELQNRELISDINNGAITPDGVFDAVVYAKGKQLNIDMEQLKSPEYKPDEVVVFFWDYDDKKALFVRNVQISDSSIAWKYDTSIQMQMKYKRIDSVRVAVAIRVGQKYKCSFIRNKEAANEDLSSHDRLIGKLYAKDRKAFIAYWTESGILCLKNRSEKAYDEEFYHAQLSGIKWKGKELIGYLEMPLSESIPEITMRSMTTKEECKWGEIEISKEGFTGLKSVYRVSMDLSEGCKDYEDAYCLSCKLDNDNFDVTVEENVLEGEDIHTITTAEETIDVMAVREKNGLFALQLSEKIYPVMLSVVTAVYNTAPFLAEMINSVLMQETQKADQYIIGNETDDYKNRRYKQLFEFILVDDGSTDGSAEILDDYARMSDKIRVIHKENGGVSSARNAGIEVARGKYITFPDSDDLLNPDALCESLSFFEKYESQLALVTIPIKLFDMDTGEHWANYKFTNRNRLIDVDTEPNAVLYAVTASMMKLSSLKEIRFNTNLKKSEDTLFINTVLINEGKKIGAVGKTCYWYRKRSVGEASAMQLSKFYEYSYTYTIENVSEKILANALEKYGYIPKFVQYTIMGQLQWQFSQNDKGENAISVLGNNGYKIYKEKLLSLLKYIDDDVIMNQKKFYSEHHYYLLHEKYKQEPEMIIDNGDIAFSFNKSRIKTTVGNCYIQIDFMTIDDGILHIEGFDRNIYSDVGLEIYVNGEIKEYNRVQVDKNKYSLDDIVIFANVFSIDINLDEDEKIETIEFKARVKDVLVNKKKFKFSKTMPLSDGYKKSYYMHGGWSIRYEKGKLIAYNLKHSNAEIIDFEKEFVDEIKTSKNKTKLEEALFLRSVAMNLKTQKSKKIWLIYDRENVARDNGEAMFRFLSEKKDPNIDAYFVINESAPDFNKMQKIGKTIARGSKNHLIMRLVADYIVSSSGDDIVINPWKDSQIETNILKDLLNNTKIIYLKHGIVLNNMSKWLNRYNKNITAFVCAAEREAQAFMDYDYYYSKDNIWMTGLPRHDRLYHDEKKYVTIMPTWRKWLTNGTNGQNNPDKNFTSSEYYKFYNDLINDERLLKSAEQNQYKICFMPHPNIQSVINEFNHDDRVLFFAFEKPYNEIFAESNLVITDYSSATMDFALMGKPVVYCQFDEDMFFENHTVKHGYFDYEKDGFGEVTYDKDALINLIISYLENGCTVKDIYKQRMERFFAFHDKNNCERVYRKIKLLEE